MHADTAVLLLNHGAADAPEGVQAFLFNIFKDLDIIALPGGRSTQEGLARLISSRRAPRVVRLYQYMGGGSPLVPYMRVQAQQLEAAVGLPVAIGLRYYRPSFADALADVLGAKATKVVVFPQYPQHSDTTVGSVLAHFEMAVRCVPGAEDLDVAVVEPFGAEPAYVELMASRVREAAAECGADPVLLFSAHSVPMSKVEAGDRYPAEVEDQAALIADAAGFGDRFEIAYQSRSGPVRWLGPDVGDFVRELVASGRRDLLVVPISFVQDHLETLVEIDVQLAAEVAAAGGRLRRVRAVNADPAFAQFSAELVRRAQTSFDAT